MKERNGIDDFSRADYRSLLEFSLRRAQEACLGLKALGAICPLQEMGVVHTAGMPLERFMLNVESAIEYFKEPEAELDEAKKRWFGLIKPDPKSGDWRYLPVENRFALWQLAGRILDAGENGKEAE